MKPLIKLLKVKPLFNMTLWKTDEPKSIQLFRDANDPMNGISSYALKTVVMNMIAEQPSKDWKPSQKAELFLEVKGVRHRT